MNIKNKIKITVNGKQMQVIPKYSVKSLIVKLKMPLNKIAIELNKNGNIKIPSSYDIEINKPCLIPEMYIDDIYMRLKYYRMISSCKDENELEELLFTIQDIYGPAPEELNNLLIISSMKQKLSNKNIQRLKIYNDSVTIQLNKQSVLKFSLESDDLRTNCDEIIERVNNSN